MASLGSLVIELAANTAGLQSDMGKAVRIAEGAVGKITSVFGGLAGLGVGVGLSQIASHAIEVGDNLNKAAIKAGVTGQTMSELAYVAKMADVDLQGLSTGLKFMQKNLSEAGSGSQQAATDLAALGLNISQLKALSPDQQFELLADRINSMTDPADKARAAVAMFGKAGSELLPLFAQGAEGIRKAREEAQRLGIALSNEQISKLAESDDSIKRLKASWEGFSTKLMASVAPAVSHVFDVMSGAKGSELKRAEAALKSIADGYDEVGKAALRAKIATLQAEETKSMFASAAGAFSKTMAPGAGGAPGYSEADKAKQSDAQKAADAEVKRRADIRAQVEQKQFEDMISSLLWQVAEDEKANEQMTRSAETHARLQREIADGELKIQQANTQAFIKSISDDWDAYYQNQRKGQEGVAEFAEQAARNMQSAFANFLFDPFKGGLKGMLSGFVDIIRRMIAEAMAAQVLKSLFGAMGGLGGFLGTALGAVTGAPVAGARAGGGSVSAGSTYLVGERGPELFTPGISGGITPNHRLAGAGGVTVAPVYNIDARGATTDLVKQLPAILEASNQRAVAMARAQIRDDLSRGAFRR